MKRIYFNDRVRAEVVGEDVALLVDGAEVARQKVPHPTDTSIRKAFGPELKKYAPLPTEAPIAAVQIERRLTKIESEIESLKKRLKGK